MPDFPGTLKPPRIATPPASPSLGQVYYDTNSNTLYWWNGTTWVAATGQGTPPTRTVFTSGSGTYTTPAGCKAIFVECVGGGGAGGGAAALSAGQGGAGGGGGGGGYSASIIA